MNQILEYDVQYGRKKSNNGGNGSKSDKIVRFFAIILIIFAFALIGSGVYSVYQNKKSQQVNTETIPELLKAQILAEANEDNDKVLVSIESDTEIDKIIYEWNIGYTRTMDGENKKKIDFDIILPSGDNTLKISVKDKENRKLEKTFEFSADNDLDITRPEITLERESNKLIITATDETEIDYITYMWDGEEQITVKAEEGQKKIVKELEIPEGEHMITVIAVDSNKTKPNTISQTHTFKAFYVPEIKLVFSSDKSKVDVICTHRAGVKNIKCEFNGKKLEANFEGNDITNNRQFTLPSIEGNNKLSVVVIGADDKNSNVEKEWKYTSVNGDSVNENNENSVDNQSNNNTNNTVSDSTSNTSNVVSNTVENGEVANNTISDEVE